MITLPSMTVVGTLVADPELRFTPNGVAVANFTIASNDRKKNPQTGEWEDGDATFLRGQIWREYGEHVAESLRKGQRVVAIGQLRQRSYEKDGEQRTAYELDAEELTPSLRWANAVVTKVSGGGQRGGNGNGGAPARSSGGGFGSQGGGLRAPAGRAPAPAYEDSEPPF